MILEKRKVVVAHLIFDKYGIVAFEIEILDEDLSRAELVEMFACDIVDKSEIGKGGRANQKYLDVTRITTQDWNHKQTNR